MKVLRCPTNPNQPKSQIILEKKSPPQDFFRKTLIPAILIRYELSVDHVYNSSVMQICAEVEFCTMSVFKKYSIFSKNPAFFESTPYKKVPISFLIVL